MIRRGRGESGTEVGRELYGGEAAKWVYGNKRYWDKSYWAGRLVSGPWANGLATV